MIDTITAVWRVVVVCRIRLCKVTVTRPGLSHHMSQPVVKVRARWLDSDVNTWGSKRGLEHDIVLAGTKVVT